MSVDILEKLQRRNPEIKLFDIHDKLFSQYGRILDNSNFVEAQKYLNEQTEIPHEGNIYIAHDSTFFGALSNTSQYDNLFNGVELEYGYVNGKNNTLNAVEYHNSYEINIAATPMIILLGKYEDIHNKKYETNRLQAFYVPECTTILLYPKVLHFSPFRSISLGFKCGVILPFGTNMNFINASDIKKEEDYCLFKTNKWLLAHKENQKAINSGAYVGLIGKNTIIEHI